MAGGSNDIVKCLLYYATSNTLMPGETGLRRTQSVNTSSTPQCAFKPAFFFEGNLGPLRNCLDMFNIRLANVSEYSNGP